MHPLFPSRWMTGRRFPHYHFRSFLLAESREDHTCSLIDSISGKRVSLDILNQRLPGIWGLKGTIEILYLANQFYLFSFSQASDMVKVRQSSSWSIVGQKLIVKNWCWASTLTKLSLPQPQFGSSSQVSQLNCGRMRISPELSRQLDSSFICTISLDPKARKAAKQFLQGFLWRWILLQPLDEIVLGF